MKAKQGSRGDRAGAPIDWGCGGGVVGGCYHSQDTQPLLSEQHGSSNSSLTRPAQGSLLSGIPGSHWNAPWPRFASSIPTGSAASALQILGWWGGGRREEEGMGSWAPWFQISPELGHMVPARRPCDCTSPLEGTGRWASWGVVTR